MALVVTKSVLHQLEEEARKAFPEECCGLLFGSDSLINGMAPAKNVATDRHDRFEIDPQTLIDAHRAARSGGPRLAGYYHSHPRGPASPSPIDQAEAAGDGMVWAIVGADIGSGRERITFWRDVSPRFEHLSYHVQEG